MSNAKNVSLEGVQEQSRFTTDWREYEGANAWADRRVPAEFV